MAADLRKDLPEELEAVIDDHDPDLNQQFILEYIYENDIRSVSERCDRTDLGDNLNLSDDQIDRATQALAAAGFITIEEFPSKYYYVLDIPAASDQDKQPTDHPGPSADGGASQDDAPTKSTCPAVASTESETTSSTEPAAASSAAGTISSDGDASSHTAPPARADHQQALNPSSHSSPVASQATTPPKPAVFVVATAAISGFLHYLGIFPQAAALSTLLLVTIVYSTAYALTLHDITPGQLSDAVEARL